MQHLFFEIIVCLMAGALTGLASGLLGIGGGLICVPFLSYFLPYLHISSVYIMHVAVATSLAIVAPTAFASAIGHYFKQAIDIAIIKKMIFGMILGAFIGAQFADMLSSNILRFIFAGFVFFMAYRLFQPAKQYASSPMILNRFALESTAFLIASFCTLVGIGGGSFFVPYFTYLQLPMKRAVATSAACGFFVAISGIIGLLIAGYGKTLNIPYASGYIYWPAFIAITVSSIPFAFLGVKLTHRLPTMILRRIFAILLLFVGVNMLYKAIV
jgi:uncharacterized protein